MIQNQIITLLSNQVRQYIIKRVIDSKWLTVITDEVTDVSNREQLSVVLHSIDDNTLVVREDQVVFIECDEGISVHDLTNKTAGIDH